MTALFIDGNEVEVKPGTTVLEACRDNGVDVPFFCYHPELSVAANCRMCLVEIEGWNKPAASCCTPVQEGMKVTTKSDTLDVDRKMVMEYLLINHPLDCPVCDEGGDCKLQNYTVAFGAAKGRYGEVKRSAINYDLGPFVNTCMTRCIHCTRCVRFADEIAGTGDIGMLGRGDRMHITGIVEECLESELSGNLPDVCPVGALLDKPSHNISRPWEMTSHQSACIQCPQGCDISIESRDGEVMRIKPQEGGIEPWICDRGRYVYDAFSSDKRILHPMLREADGSLCPAGWDEAIAAAVPHLNGKRVGVICSTDWTMEGLTAVRLFTDTALPDAKCGFDLHRRDMRSFAFSEGFAMTSEQLEAADQVVVLGSDLRQRLPLVMQRLRKRINAGQPVVRIGAMHYRTDCKLTKDLLVRPRDWHAVIARAMEQMSSVGKTAAGMQEWLGKVEARHEAGKALADALIADSCALLVGEEIRGHSDAASLIYGLDLLMRACGHAEKETDGRNLIPTGMNAQPLEKLFSDQRESVGTLLEKARDGDLDTLLLIGSDPFGDGLFPAEFQQAADSCTIIQIAAIEGASSAYADIQLPSSCYAEVDGTFVNMVGRLRTSTLPLTPPEGEGRPLWKVMMRLLQAMGGDIPAVSLAELRKHCEQLIPGSEHAWDGSAVDSALMPVARDRKAAHLPAQQSQLKVLDVVSRYSMYREGTWARASRLLVDAGKLHALADVIVHPKTLQEAGFAPGDAVTIRAYRGSFTHHVGVRDDVSEGVLFVARRGVAGVLASDTEAELMAVGGDS